MAYFDVNDPVRQQLAERFEMSGLGPTITLDPITGETLLGTKRNPTARDYQKAYERYIQKGGEQLSTPQGMSSNRLMQHALFKGKGMSYYTSKPYVSPILNRIQEDMEEEEEASPSSAVSSPLRRVVEEQIQDDTATPPDIFGPRYTSQGFGGATNIGPQPEPSIYVDTFPESTQQQFGGQDVMATNRGPDGVTQGFGGATNIGPQVRDTAQGFGGANMVYNTPTIPSDKFTSATSTGGFITEPTTAANIVWSDPVYYDSQGRSNRITQGEDIGQVFPLDQGITYDYGTGNVQALSQHVGDDKVTQGFGGATNIGPTETFDVEAMEAANRGFTSTSTDTMPATSIESLAQISGISETQPTQPDAPTTAPSPVAPASDITTMPSTMSILGVETPTDFFGPAKDLISEIESKGADGFISGKIQDTINQAKNDPAKFAFDSALAYGTGKVFETLLGGPATAIIGAASNLVDFSALQVGVWGTDEITGTPSQIAGYNAQGLAVNSNGNVVLTPMGTYNFKNLSSFFDYIKGDDDENTTPDIGDDVFADMPEDEDPTIDSPPDNYDPGGGGYDSGYDDTMDDSAGGGGIGAGMDDQGGTQDTGFT